MRICFTDVFFCFFFAFSVRHKNTRQPFSGRGERVFMKLLPNDSGENGVSNAVSKWGLGLQIIFRGLKTKIAKNRDRCISGTEANFLTLKTAVEP